MSGCGGSWPLRKPRQWVSEAPQWWLERRGYPWRAIRIGARELKQAPRGLLPNGRIRQAGGGAQKDDRAGSNLGC
jgi:hypothetical protein